VNSPKLPSPSAATTLTTILMNAADVVFPRALDHLLTRVLTIVRGKPVFESSPPRRFQYESLGRLLQRYETHRATGDIPSAMSYFERLADYQHRKLVHSSAFDSTRPSIVSMFQPKSGGTFLHQRMLQLGYQDFWWFFPQQHCHATCYASDAALRRYSAGGCTCHSHARPDANILAALDRAGVGKVWVHLRNPAECVVSSYYHYRGEGHGGGTRGELRKQEALAAAQRQGIAPNADLSTFVVEHVDWHIDWAERWLQFAKQQPDRVVFSFYGELIDPQALFERVLNEFGSSAGGVVVEGPNERDRYRRKAVKDWRYGLSSAAERHLTERIQSSLSGYPEFKRLWS
jgi:hypothetical protein